MLNSQFFRFDYLSVFSGGLAVFFTVLIAVYSRGYFRERKGNFSYYLYLFLTLVASLGVVFANHLILFLVFWGFLGLLLYLLVSRGEKENTPATAKKAFIIIGGTDALMLLGAAVIWRLSGTFDMDKIRVPLTGRLAWGAYLCLAAGALAKAGAMPFHTWVPDVAVDAPTPVTAYLPASLDKILGIYFLARLSLNLFQLTPGANTLLMALGSFTIIAAVMMALVQHDLKRLLGYHAVSQVGYMVLGIGTGNPLGIAGGLFHMLNHTIYKTGLFLSAGVVEKKTGTTELDRMGGLAKIMPITFISFLIAALAISGVPPLNGFVSKWMIYQGVIEAGKSGGGLWVVWLAAAIFGSALTLASFMKALYAVFLRRPASDLEEESGKTSPFLWVPPTLLAVLCVVFGVFAYRTLHLFIYPCLSSPVHIFGLWSAGAATVLLLIGLALGLVIYLINAGFKTRPTEIFIGGETIAENPGIGVSPTTLYNTVAEIPFLKKIYSLAEEKVFDIYDLSTGLTLSVSGWLRRRHHGVLTGYLSWLLVGLIILLFILSR